MNARFFISSPRLRRFSPPFLLSGLNSKDRYQQPDRTAQGEKQEAEADKQMGKEGGQEGIESFIAAKKHILISLLNLINGVFPAGIGIEKGHVI